MVLSNSFREEKELPIASLVGLLLVLGCMVMWTHACVLGLEAIPGITCVADVAVAFPCSSVRRFVVEGARGSSGGCLPLLRPMYLELVFFREKNGFPFRLWVHY